MIKSKITYSLLIFIISILSCKSQTKPELLKKSPSQSAITISDYDPYFIESKTIASDYGPTSIVRNMIQAKNGDIWIASWEGIIRYDGQTFTNFTNKEFLRKYHVFCALEDRKGNLWFGTIGAGIYVYDGESFTNYTTKEGLVYDGIGCLYEDKTGHIWIGTQDGISRYDGLAKNTKEITFQNFTTADGLTDGDVNSIIEDKTGKFWIGTRGAACTYDGKNFTKFTNLVGRSFTNVRCVIEDKTGNIWLGGNDGLWRYNNGLLTNFTKNFVGCIYEDKKGNIWTNSASDSPKVWVLSRYDKNPLPHKEQIATEIRSEMNMFFGIMEDNENNIWFGTLGGICRYDCASFNYFRE